MNEQVIMHILRCLSDDIKNLIVRVEQLEGQQKETQQETQRGPTAMGDYSRWYSQGRDGPPKG